MSIKEVTFYRAACDWPDCGRTTEDLDSDYSAWGTPESASEQVVDHEWRESEGQHWCDRHPTVWESNGMASWPDPPFVLLHDPGDGSSYIGDHEALEQYLVNRKEW